MVQRFKFQVKIDQDFVEDDGDEESFYIGSWSGRNLNLVLEYTDYTVARSLISIYDDWVKGLAGEKKKQWVERVERMSHLNLSLSNIIFPVSLLLGIVAYPTAVMKLINDSPVRAIAFIMCAGLIASFLGRLIVYYLIRNASAFQTVTVLCFTNGDRDRSTRLQQAIKRKSVALRY